MSSIQDAPPSTTLVAGKYQLIGLIGRGGMGSVWEGRHATLGTRVAIKFIEAEYANSQDARNRFDNEARAAATIQSKHAIQIFDHGVTDDGKPYIVMEMLVGKPLDKRLEELGGRMKLQDTAKVIQQVSRALARAHEKGIIHRDLKPENIFLVKEDEADDEVAKVLDFGIAKIKANPGEMGISSSTKTGAVLGTPFYMSPEQARGLRTIDHRTDIWSLGVIVFRCVTGKLPFDGESVGDLLVKICTAPLPVPSHVLPGLPPGFDAWFTRAMEREPDRRFSTVQEMSDALAFAAGITFRQPNSSGGAVPGGMQGTMPLGPGGMGGATQRQSSYPGSQHTPNGYGQGAVPNTGPQPALGGTQAPFTTSARESVPMKSNKGIVIGTVAFVALVGVATIGAVTYIKRGAVAQAGQTSPQDSSKVGAGLVANGTQAPPQDTTKLPDTPGPIAATSVDPKWKDLPKPGVAPGPGVGGVAGVVPGGGFKPGVKPGAGGKPVAGNTPPTPSALPPVPPTPPVHTATTPPTPTGPPKGKVDESGF